MFVSRAGLKLDFALDHFHVDVTDCLCADLGSNTGGFVDCLLQRNARKIYSIDTGYGVLDWKLRKDPRVVVMERTNAMHATLPEKVSRVTIDVAWTKQQHILPAARRMIEAGGLVVSLVKPHYESEAKQLRKGVLPQEHVAATVEQTLSMVRSLGFENLGTVQSPIKGAKGNVEFLALLRAI